MATSSTCHMPAPPPASVMRTRSARLSLPLVTSRSWNDSDAGSVNTCGLSARRAGRRARRPRASPAPPPCARCLPQAGPAVDTSADLTCCGVHAGWSWRSSAAAPATCGAAMLVPSKTANGEPPVNSGKVDERICPPGAETSGLSRCSNAVGPPEEKLVMTPLRPVSTRSIAFPIVTSAAPPCVARYARSCAPSRSVIIPAGSGSSIGIASGPPERLSTMTSPVAPAAAARTAFEMNVQCPRETSATSPFSEPGRRDDLVAIVRVGRPGRRDGGRPVCRSSP